MNIQNQQTEQMEILRQAIDALSTETGIQIEIEDAEPQINGDDYQADALISIGPNKGIFVETKRYAQRANIGAIINQVQRLPGKAVLVADYINPRMAEKLRKENIQYFDTTGNAYLDLDLIYILIAGKKQNKEHLPNSRDHANRAFEPKGLLVTYGFLTNSKLLNRSYREIATETNVALGTVGWVIKALKAGRYIHDDVRNKHRRITNYQLLLDRWVEAWPEKLKPKLFLGTFVTDDIHEWGDIKIEQYGGYWGGETAGALYTNHLKPEIATVYIPKHKYAKLVQDMRLSKEPKLNHYASSKINIYTPFWQVNNHDTVNEDTFDESDRFSKKDKRRHMNTRSGLVHPVLAYADLIATGDARNLEVARILYDEQIARLNQ